MPLRQKERHLRRTVTETRSHFRSFPTTCWNLEESNTRVNFKRRCTVRVEANMDLIQTRMSSLNQNMSDPVAALTHQISCWTVLRHLVDKTNRILEEVLQARHVSKHEENHKSYSKYWKLYEKSWQLNISLRAIYRNHDRNRKWGSWFLATTVVPMVPGTEACLPIIQVPRKPRE